MKQTAHTSENLRFNVRLSLNTQNETGKHVLPQPQAIQKYILYEAEFLTFLNDYFEPTNFQYLTRSICSQLYFKIMKAHLTNDGIIRSIFSSLYFKTMKAHLTNDGIICRRGKTQLPALHHYGNRRK